MRFDILSLFPDIFQGYLGQSLLNKAIRKGIVQVHLHNLRDWTHDKHHKIDDRPYGGGPGMVLMAPPVVEAVEQVRGMDAAAGHLILLSPQGRRLDQRKVEQLAEQQRLIVLCGRYEGFDQRVVDLLQPEELSIGDYILGGGEVAAMVLVDAVVRLVPGVLGDEESSRHDSFSGTHGYLEYPQYTRPVEFRGLRVPEVLLSGDHQRIARWREEQSYLRTRQRRSDLLDDRRSGSQNPGPHPADSPRTPDG